MTRFEGEVPTVVSSGGNNGNSDWGFGNGAW